MALSRPGSGVRDVPAQDFIVALAQHFKKTQKVGAERQQTAAVQQQYNGTV